MTVKLKIDGREVEVKDGATIMEAADTAGIRIPRFCYHPRLTAPANCRICAVEVAGRDGLVMSCQEKAQSGMVVETNTEAVRRSREDVLEFMLANHPLDCPVCDRAGECDLQDYYFEHSRRPSRRNEPKVRKPKAVSAGPRVILDAERCVACTRCIRFLEEVVGVHELGLYDRGESTKIGVAPGAELSNPYSLCTVDLCPVGALTSRDFRFRKRAWLLESSPTICAGCARGCNVWLDHSDGMAVRLRPRENPQVNGEWMCDAGRMSYAVLNTDRRLSAPRVLKDGDLVDATWDEALERAGELIGSGGASDSICVLSARASMEENRAMANFSKGVLGSNKIFFSGEPLDPDFADGLLRLDDRNPNTNGARTMADHRVGEVPTGCGAVILETPAPGDIVRLIGARPAWVILLTSSKEGLGRWPDVVLPKLTHFEQAGTFVGEGLRAQRFERAIECEGEAVGAPTALERLARILGKGGIAL